MGPAVAPSGKKVKTVPFDPMSFVVIGLALAVYLLGTGIIMVIFAFVLEDKKGMLSVAEFYGIPTKYLGVAFIVSGLALVIENIALWLVYKQAYVAYMGRPRLYSMTSVDATPKAKPGPAAV